MTTPDPGLTAALLKIAEHTERLALVESKVTENLSQCEMGTAGVSGAVLDLRAVVEAQGTLLESLNELVKTLVPPAEPEGPKPYRYSRPSTGGQSTPPAAGRPSSTCRRGSTTCTGPTTGTWP